MRKRRAKAMWFRILLLLLTSNVIILAVSVLRANFVDTVEFSLTSLLDPRFWLRNPALLLILALCGVWFMLTMLASQSASIASQTKLTASIYGPVLLGIGSVFMLIKFAVYEVFHREMITQTMWLWAYAIACIISCVAWFVFLTEGQRVIS